MQDSHPVVVVQPDAWAEDDGFLGKMAVGPTCGGSLVGGFGWPLTLQRLRSAILCKLNIYQMNEQLKMPF